MKRSNERRKARGLAIVTRLVMLLEDSVLEPLLRELMDDVIEEIAERVAVKVSARLEERTGEILLGLGLAESPTPLPSSPR